MINEIISMNGYWIYVWSAFSFTLISFGTLFYVTKLQLSKEQKKFVSKFGLLNAQKSRVAKKQNINKAILANTLSFKI
jgi:heme exporter protein D